MLSHKKRKKKKKQLNLVRAFAFVFVTETNFIHGLNHRIGKLLRVLFCFLFESFFLPQTNQLHWKGSFFDLEHSVTMWDVLVGEKQGMLTLQVTKNKRQSAVGCRLLCPLRVKLLGLASRFQVSAQRRWL